MSGGSSLELRTLSVAIGRRVRLLHDVSLVIDEGEVVGVTGSSGAGKTTLLHTLSGLVPWLRPARVDGAVDLAGEPLLDLDPGQRAHLVATCLDRPDAQLYLATPRQELAAARRLYGGDGLGEEAVERLELDRLLDRRIATLSSGERQRVALAVALTGCPRPLLLDEPSAHLDDDGADALAGLLRDATARGGLGLLTEHAGWRLDGAACRWFHLGAGRLRTTGPPRPPPLPAPLEPPRDEVVLSASGVDVARGGTALLEGIDLHLRAGEVVLLQGPNGAGKSTLALVLAGLQKPESGSVSSDGPVALMLPEGPLQLFAPTVLDEVSGAGRPEDVARVLRRHRLELLAARAPWTLSRGEQQRLVHAVMDLMRPRVLLIDEPGQGLDPDDLAALVELVHRRAARGRAYLLISHRRELRGAVHRVLEIRDGRVVAHSTRTPSSGPDPPSGERPTANG